MDRRNCSAVSGVQELKQVKGFTAANFAQDNSIGPVPQSRFQKFADGYGRQTILFAAGFKSQDVLFLNLYFCCVLDQDNALVVRDEFGQHIR